MARPLSSERRPPVKTKALGGPSTWRRDDARQIAGALLVASASACVRYDDNGALQTVADSVLVVSGAPGVIVAVRTPSGALHRAASGVADRESGRPIRVDDAFRLGSVSKTYTATVVLRLVEDGLLSLDDRVSQYFPGFPRGDEVSVRQLLDHTSGLRDFYLYLYLRPDRDEMIALVTRRWSEQELVELSARFGFSFDPGAVWAYSNTNYYLLGVIIERVTGRPLGHAYQTYIYEPLEITDTWLGEHEPAGRDAELPGHPAPRDRKRVRCDQSRWVWAGVSPAGAAQRYTGWARWPLHGPHGRGMVPADLRRNHRALHEPRVCWPTRCARGHCHQSDPTRSRPGFVQGLLTANHAVAPSPPFGARSA